jgi:large subunit ribosomal protein L21
MKYAVVKTGGKQYKISEGDVLEVERISLGDQKEILFDDVLMYTADGAVRIGTPLLTGIEIKATVLGQIKGKKIRVAKYKAKVRYRRVSGHRQLLTKVQIKSIQPKGKADAAPAEKKKTAAKVAK